MTTFRLGALALCAALACAGSASSQTGGRPAPRMAAPPAPATPSTNPTLAMPMKTPVLASDPQIMLSQINLLRAEVTALQKQTAELQKLVSGLQEQNANQESRIDSVAVRLENHQHTLNGIGFKTVPSVTCKPTPGGYPSCSPDQFPSMAMVIPTPGDADKAKALTTSKPIK